MATVQSNEVGAVTAAVEALKKAMVSGDRTALDTLTADELTYVHSSARLENKAEFIETLASGKSGFTAIETSDQSVRIVDKVALVTHRFVGTRKQGDPLKLLALTVWLQRQGQWKLLARHATKV